MLEKKLAEKTVQLNLVFFDEANSYDVMQRAQSGQFGLEYIDLLFSIIKNTISLVLLMIVIAAISVTFMFSIALFLVPSFFIYMYVGKLKVNQMINLTPLNRKINYIYSLLTGKEAAKELRVFDLGYEIVRRWGELFHENAKHEVALFYRTKRLLFIYEIIVLALLGALLVVAVLLVAAKAITVGQFVAFSQTATNVRALIVSMSTEVGRIYEISLQASQYFSFINLPEETKNNELLCPDFTAALHVEHLVVSYPNRERPALDGISFTVKKGEKIAIVGGNGAGKTTLVKCIMGLYTHYTGEISLDGREIRDMDKQSLRSRITALFQDYTKYELTLYDNIAFGDIQRSDNAGKVEQAAAKGGVSEFVDSIRGGYEGQLGPAFLGGQELSIGQWQRVALSRTFMRDADIVILDEPTAALDPLAEASVIQQFLNIADEKTAIIISHRLGVCRHVDRILVLDNGTLAGEGTHEELLESNLIYKEMYESQLRLYT